MLSGKTFTDDASTLIEFVTSIKLLKINRKTSKLERRTLKENGLIF